MARPFAVLALALALVLFTVAGLASADTAPSSEVPTGDAAPEAAVATVPAFGPSSDDEIGNSEDDASHAEDAAVEAPVGGPVPPGAFTPTAESPQSGAATIKVSAAAGVAVTTAISSFFFF